MSYGRRHALYMCECKHAKQVCLHRLRYHTAAHSHSGEARETHGFHSSTSHSFIQHSVEPAIDPVRSPGKNEKEKGEQ